MKLHQTARQLDAKVRALTIHRKTEGERGQAAPAAEEKAASLVKKGQLAT